MSQGRLIGVVGPSGVGKDSLIDAMMAAYPAFRRARRVITRPASAGGEDFDGVTEADFERRKAAGAFALSWGAHGLFYGVPVESIETVSRGALLLANLSRSVVGEAARLYPAVHILSVTAPPEVLVHRLAGRGRETARDIARRLARPAPPPPPGVPISMIDNGAALEVAVDAALTALDLR